MSLEPWKTEVNRVEEEKKKTRKDVLSKEQGVKHDSGKLRWDLVPPNPMEELVKVYTAGASKYADRNWEKGMAWGRIFAAILRHIWAWRCGLKKDEESGLHPLAHAAWGCFALIEFERTHPELNDLEVTLNNTLQ